MSESVAAIASSVEEIRVALALNGGVSLAVWMGGCAVELDCARRAHLGPEDLAYEGFAPSQSTTQVRTVYNALCTAFGRQLVPDILCGASAGGINGALLGAAMAGGRRLHPEFVRRAWIDLGDFSRLLHPATEEEPRSLMQGKLFHESLETAFEAILGSDPDAADAKASSLPAGQPGREDLVPKLEVTMTDVFGVERTFQDEWGGELIAREHRACFSFAEAEDYTAENLAAAARTSASFPVAFEPWPIDAQTKLAGLKDPTYAIDGGLLDNAPIKTALDLIPGQRATNRVRRYACYLNADPPQPAPPGTGAVEPGLDDVVGYIVNLPRLAPFVDQLYAVERASRRASLTSLIQPSLLRLPLEVLLPTADALLEAYRKRRAILSLQELMTEPADAAKVVGLLGQPAMRLPWLPEDLDPPYTPSEWRWGVSAAQRVLHLVLDLIRPAVEVAGGEEPPSGLLALRETIDAALDRLDELHAEMRADEAIGGALLRLAALADSPGITTNDGEHERRESIESVSEALAELVRPYSEAAFEPTRAAIESLHQILSEEAGLDRQLRERLFGNEDSEEAHPRWGPEQHFLARALAIEVLRRALSADADVDSAEPLRFVQLTPSAPTPILAATPPRKEVKPAEPRDKLTGVGLGHFAGFYRSSWRANDYMWGRLDAAARIVEMLLDEVRVAPGEEVATAKSLAAVVVPANADEGARWLVHEALDEICPEYELAGDCVPDANQLRAQLEKAIEEELKEPDENRPAPAESTGAPLTRIVCTRAVQLEILQDELPVLVEESARDAERGSSSPPLELPLDKGMRATIETLRERTAKGEPLPRQLDDTREEVSDLGLRTITHTVFVSLSAARASGAPLAKFFGLVRAPLQAVSGSVSASPLHRGTLAMAFWAAALYLTMRFATTQAGEAPLSIVWSKPVLVSLVAALAVLGVILVPVLRAARKVHAGRNWLWAAALAAVGGLGAALLARYAGDDLTTTNVVFATNSEQLPGWLLTLVLAVAVGLSAVRLPFFGSAATSWLASLRSGWRLCAPLIAVSVTVAATSVWRLWPLLGDSRWEQVAAILAIFAAPVVIVAYLLVPLALNWLAALRRRLAKADVQAAPASNL